VLQGSESRSLAEQAMRLVAREQGLGVLQIGGVKALGEPALDRAEHPVVENRLSRPVPAPPIDSGSLRLLACGNRRDPVGQVISTQNVELQSPVTP
jgi:hypothetical protein